MAGLTAAELEAVVSVDDRPFASGLGGMLGMLDQWGGKATKIAGGVALGMGAAFAGASVAGIRSFAALEEGMNEVFTLMPGITDKAMGDMTDDVKDFAKEFGVLPDEVVPALYQSISAGVPPGNVFDFLETAQKAAKGGVTDLTTAVDGITSVVNSYGADVVDAAKASDLLFTAVRFGKTNFEELSGSLYNVIPTASALGVEFADVTAALAAMTSQGTPTNVATTQMRQLLVELSKAGTETSETFKAVAGEGFKEFIAGGGNVQGALQLLEDHAGKTGVGVNDLFGSVEAGSAALALTGKGTGKFNEALAGMQDSAGATETAYDRMNQGLSASWDRIVATVVVAINDLGQAWAPLIQDIADFAEKALPSIVSALAGVPGAFGEAADAIAPFLDFIEDNQTALTVLAGIIAAVFIPHLVALGVASLVNGAKAAAGWVMQQAASLGYAAIHSVVVALVVAGWVSMGVQSLVQAARVAAAWVIAMGPIGWVIAAVVALAALIIANWDTIREWTAKAWDAVAGKVSDVWDKIKGWTVGAVQKVIGFVKNNWPKLLALLGGPIGLAVLAIVKHWDKIKEGVGDVFGAIAALPGKVIGLGGKFLGAGKAVLGKLIDGLTAVGGFVGDIAAGVKDAVLGAINAVIRSMNGAIPDKIPVKGLPDINLPNNPIPEVGFATGGRVTGATYAVLGEGREPESILPDSVLRGLLSRVHDSGEAAALERLLARMPDGMGRRVEANFHGMQGATARELIEELEHALRVEEYGGVYAGAGAAA